MTPNTALFLILSVACLCAGILLDRFLLNKWAALTEWLAERQGHREWERELKRRAKIRAKAGFVVNSTGQTLDQRSEYQ